METPTSVNSCEVNRLHEMRTDKLESTATVSAKNTNNDGEGKNNASLHGISYQLQLGLVVLLRLFKMHKEDHNFEFKLTFEDPDAGKFDDIIVYYSSPKHASKGIVRIQAKHRQIVQTGQKESKYDIITAADLLSTKKNAAFSIGMYFESFLNLHKPKLEETQTYILCTNKRLDRYLGMANLRYKNTSDFYILEFLQDIRATSYQFDYSNKLEGLDKNLENAVDNSSIDKNEFNKDCKIDAIKTFYDNFFLVCGSANETELYDVAIGLLKELLQFKNITTYEKLHYKMFDAINKGPKSFKPTDMEKMLKQTEDSFIQEHLRINTSKQVDSSRAKYFEIKFCPTTLGKTNLFKFLANETPGTLFYRSSYGTEVSVLIIEQTVKLAKYELVLINLSSYVTSEVTKELCNDISTICKHERNKAAMLITIIPQEKLFKRQELEKLIQEYDMKLVIVQHVKKDDVSSIDTDIVDVCVDSFLVEDLTDDTRTRLLKKCINLFGTSVALEKILEQNDPLSYLFELILMNEKESKSLHETKYDEIDHWYVDRRFVSYKQDETDYFDDNNNLPGLKDGNISCQVHIILNDAGFGKSSCFTKLSWRLSNIIHSSFVIRLNAVDFSTDFKRLMKTDVRKLDAAAVLKILYRFIHLALFVHDGSKQTDSDIGKRRKEAHTCSKLLIYSNARVVVDDDTAKTLNLKTSQLSCLRLFKDKLNEEQLILLLDGFDEIAPDYKELVLECLAKFAQLGGMRLVYISSRPYNFLEEFESTFPEARIYKLEPFSANDQERALCKYIRHEMKGLESGNENLMLEALLRDFQNLPIQFKTVPLFLRMAFDIRFPLVEKSISSHDKIELTAHESIDILQLIEAFVAKKLERSLLEKITISLYAKDSVTVSKLIAEPMAKTKKKHALLAMFAIFNKKTRDRLLNEQEQREAKTYMEKMGDASEKTGIIVEVQDNIPQFILRILAEYFVALWMYENFDRLIKQDFFRNRLYWTHEYLIIREFMNRMVLRRSKGCDIHLAVLHQSEEQLNKLLSERPFLALKKDALGRLPLHLAVSNKGVHIFEKLLKNMSLASINVRDKLFQWSALDYAFFAGCDEFIKMLLTRGAEVNIDTLLQQLCLYKLKSILIYANDYGKYLLSNVNTKAIADQLIFRIVDYLLDERQLDIHSQHAQLGGLTVLGYCIKHNCDRLFKPLYLKVCNSTHESLEMSEQLLNMAFEHKVHTIISYLIDERNIPLPEINDSAHLISALNALVEENRIKSYQNVFHQLCILRHVSIDEDAQFNEHIFLQSDHNIPALDKAYHPKVCCVHSSKNVRLPLPEYDEQDVLYDGYVIEALLAKAVHYGNVQVLNYIARKTNTTITNRLIVSVMRLLPKTKDVCHEKSMGAFQYLLDRTIDLHNVDEEGRNLLHMTAQNGCFFMMHCLIVKGFGPTLTNVKNGWNTCHYLAYNDDEDNRCSNTLEYLLREERLNWFDLMDSMIFSDGTGKNDTVSNDTISNIRIHNSDKLSKQQYALLGLLAVFQGECKKHMYTEQECAESIALMQQTEQAKKTSGIISRVLDNIPVFKHQIFAEYFAACWLFENKDHMRSETFFRSWLFWSYDLFRVRDIFDRMVLTKSNGCAIHLAVLNQSSTSIEVSKLLSVNPSLALEKDALGRLPLHLAARNKWRYPFEQLVKIMTLESINERDELFQWSALDYAFVTTYYKHAGMLLARGAEVNLDTLFQQLCSNNLRDIVIISHSYGYVLAHYEKTKAIADQLIIRVADHLFNKRRLDIHTQHTELDGFTVLEYCVKRNFDGLFKQLYLKVCISPHHSLKMSEQLLKMAFEHKAHAILFYLMNEHSIPLPQTNNSAHLISALNSLIVKNPLKTFQTIFQQLCQLRSISVVEDAYMNDNMFLTQDQITPALDKYHQPRVCCVQSSKNVRLPLPEYDEQDVLHKGYVIEAFMAKAVHYGNTEVLNYIVRKTNITITNRLIVSVMRLLPKTEDVCHEKSIGAFQYLLDRTTDLHNVDEEDRNLLHMTAQNGCFFMMHCLIVKGFDPTLTNAKNGWKTFHYLAFNDDDGDRSNRSLEYLMYEDKFNWFDLLDAMLFTDNIGVSETVTTTTNTRTQNSVKINKQQHALLGLLAVFKEECRNNLFTEEERAGAIALLQQLEQADKTSGIIERKVHNSIPVFKHHIFAEYFAACWLYENKDRFRSVPFFRSWSFWKNDFHRLRDIFDRIVLRGSKGCEVHLAVVNQSVQQVITLLSENPSLALAKDAFGRLPLNLAARNKWRLPFYQLLKIMTLESINARDELFQWSALDYAFVTGYSKRVEMLLASGTEVNLETLLQQLCSNNIRNILLIANSYGKFLLSSENTKAFADQLNFRVVDYLFNERRLDIHKQHAELDGLSILNFCNMKKCNVMLLKCISQAST